MPTHRQTERQIDIEDVIAASVRPAPLNQTERAALEFMQLEIRAKRNVSPADVATFLKADSVAFAAQVIENLINKGHLSRQYTVLMPSIREVVKFGKDGQQEVVR
jgi:hypothetical protein